MEIRWLLQACIVVAVGMGFVSCTKAEIEQAMNRPAEIMLQSSPCTPAGIASTATPEFCINVMEIHLTSHDTQADVSLTLVNRTGRRHFIYVSGMPSMIDSSGTKWIGRRHTGLGSGTHYPVPVEPNVETQGSITFYQSGQATTDLTFSLRGEIAIMQVDSRGQPIPFKIVATRGFNISGIRLPQPPPQSSVPTELNQDTKLAQVSPQGVDTTMPKTSVSAQSSVPGVIAGTSGSGKPNSPETIPTKQNTLLLASPGLGLAGSSKASPDVLGIKVGISTVADVRRALGKATPTLSVEEQYAQLRGQSTAGRAYSQWVNVEDSKYLSQLKGVTQTYQNCNISGITGNNSLAHKGNCEEIYVGFSGPPNAGTALHLRRSIIFVVGPSFDSVTRNLVEKYGEPGFHGIHGDRGVSHHFVWAWSTEGSPVRLNAQHPCTTLGQMGGGGAQESSKSILQAGCAVVLHAHLMQNNSVVQSLMIVANNDFGIYNTGVKTSAFIDDYVRTFETKEREKAEKVAAPKF